MTVKLAQKLKDIKKKNTKKVETARILEDLLWDNAKGIWKNRKIDPLNYQKKVRKEANV